MRLLSVIAVFGFAALVGSAADEKKPEPAKKDDSGVREIDLKGAQLHGNERGKWSEPTKITSGDELKKAIGEEAAKAVMVDFAKEKALLFRWAGSGQDKLTYAAETKEGKTTVTFALSPGRTKDLRQHVRLYAVPADVECKCGQ